MSELYIRIENLCKEHKISITAMCKEAMVSRGSITDLKQGRSKTLSSEAISKIAKLFDVSTDYLMTGNDAEPQSSDMMITSSSPYGEHQTLMMMCWQM